MKLLVIEDDFKTAELMRRGLQEENYVVDICSNGEDGLVAANSAEHDLIILDVMLPAMNGWNVLSSYREGGGSAPVIMLTARDAVEHRVKGLTLGADDYVVKPFAFAELLARIRTVLRRTAVNPSDAISIGDLKIDLRRHRVSRGETMIELSNREIALLSLLMRHHGEVLSRTFIEEKVWDMNFDGDSNVVDVNIRRLRSKIDDPFPVKMIQTVRGRGYVIR